ncbi:Deoxymugineic acid synthase 1 [Frankliniella fusca]|uniref:Deoxymugineic acid synthase 1 n=1 Tax=Frankliniella fusca TaxID=407009 RepID=A0AAE1LN93_9NEOP|nr:Deoxymugineic acid synthase 1 [Frankliniella fusca]
MADSTSPGSSAYQRRLPAVRKRCCRVPSGGRPPSPLRRCSKSSCRQMQVLYRNVDYKSHYAAYCKKCRSYSSLCKGTFFEGTHLSFEDCFVSLWTWCAHVSQTDTSNMTGITREARYCFLKILAMPTLQLGGEGVIVQIDESVITKRKYNRGRGLRKTIKEKYDFKKSWVTSSAGHMPNVSFLLAQSIKKLVSQ